MNNTNAENKLFIFLPWLIQKYYKNKNCSPTTLYLINSIQSVIIRHTLNPIKLFDSNVNEFNLIYEIQQIITNNKLLEYADSSTLLLINELDIVIKYCIDDNNDISTLISDKTLVNDDEFGLIIPESNTPTKKISCGCLEWLNLLKFKNYYFNR